MRLLLSSPLFALPICRFWLQAFLSDFCFPHLFLSETLSTQQYPDGQPFPGELLASATELLDLESVFVIAPSVPLRVLSLQIPPTSFYTVVFGLYPSESPDAVRHFLWMYSTNRF